MCKKHFFKLKHVKIFLSIGVVYNENEYEE